MSKKITELPAAASLAVSDVLPVVDVAASTTRKVSITVLRGAILPASLTSEVSGILPVANGGTGSAALPAGGFAGLTAMAFGDAASESNANTYTGTAITTERSAARTLTNATVVLASNTVTDTGQALGDIAYCNGTRFARLARGATAGQSLTATATTIVYSSNPGVAAQAVAALAIDWATGQVFTKTLGAGANTFTWSNQASGMTIMVRVTGAASTLTWPSGIRWAGGVTPTQTASGTDVYTFVHDGTSIYGSVVQAMA